MRWWSTDVISYGFAAIVLAGGLVGYFKAGMQFQKDAHYLEYNVYFYSGSVMSLGSGIVFGALLGYGASRTSANPKDFTFLLGQNSVTVCSAQSMT